MSRMLGDCYTSSFYASDLRAISAVSALVSCEPMFFAGLHYSVVGDVGASAEYVVGVFVGDGVAGKEVVARPFHFQVYSSDEFSLPSSRSKKPKVGSAPFRRSMN